MNDLNEDSMLELLTMNRSKYAARPSHLVVSPEGIANIKSLCDADPEFKKRVLAEFPEVEALLA